MAFSSRIEQNPKYIISGSLSRDFVIPSGSSPKMDFIGGCAAFAATGLALWDKPVGMLTRIGEDYPREWLNPFSEYGIDTRGVKILPESIDLRTFYGYKQEGSFQTHSPVGFFANIEYPFPSSLLNYSPEKTIKEDLKTRWATSPISTDFPPDYLDAVAAHICPMDFVSQSLLQSVFHSGQVRTITVEANPAYLQPEYWNEIPAVVNGLTCFFVDEPDLRQLFRGRSNETLEMAAGIGSMGCELVVFRSVDGIIRLYQHSTRQTWELPPYPVRRINYHTSKHSFAGGFLAGYILTYDPLNALIYGSVSESISSEALHPLGIFESLPGIDQVRLEVQREKLRLI